MVGANPPRQRPAVNSTKPTKNGNAVPRRSAACPATTMPRRFPRKNPLNTQPYRPSPPRSSATTGITVEMASASKATRVIVMTSPSVRRRRDGTHRPSGPPSVGAAGARTEGSSRVTACMLPPGSPSAAERIGLACCRAHGVEAPERPHATSSTSARTRRSSGSSPTCRPPTPNAPDGVDGGRRARRRCSGSRATAPASRSGPTTAAHRTPLGPTSGSRVHAIETAWLDRVRAVRAVGVPLRRRRVRAVARGRRLLGLRPGPHDRSTPRRSATCSTGTGSAPSSSGCSPTCEICATR